MVRPAAPCWLAATRVAGLVLALPTAGECPDASACGVVSDSRPGRIPGTIARTIESRRATAETRVTEADVVSNQAVDANAVLMDAFTTDVRPRLAEVRSGLGLESDPLAAYARSGYGERIVAERVGGQQAGWGA